MTDPDIIAEIKEEIDDFLKKYPDFWGHLTFQINYKDGSPVNMNLKTERSTKAK